MIKRAISVAVIGVRGVTLITAANKPATVALKDGTGKDVGTARLSDGPGGKGVKIALTLKDLPPREHALHIHTTAKCEGPAFTSAGGHFNPSSAHHGVNNPTRPKLTIMGRWGPRL